jgi:hypothetical protein
MLHLYFNDFCIYIYIGTFAAALDFFTSLKNSDEQEYWSILETPLLKIGSTWESLGISSDSGYSPVSFTTMFIYTVYILYIYIFIYLYDKFFRKNGGVTL